jgi:ABC-type Na+ efflux pump permease subunit
MRKGILSGWGKVFRFSLARTVSGKGWRLMTLIPALALLVLIPVIFLISYKEPEQEGPAETSLRAVYVADLTPGELDFSLLDRLGDPLFSGLEYIPCADASAALEAAKSRPDSLVLVLDREGETYDLQVVVPEPPNVLTMEDADRYADFLRGGFGMILPLKSGLSETQLAELLQPIRTSAEQAAAILSGEESDPDSLAKELIGSFLPYVNVMLLYFLVLFYGQNVAASVVLEKQNKLMDNFLISLRPEAMVLGKLLAGALAGILQTAAWIAGTALGLNLGGRLLSLVHPGAESSLLRVLGLLGRELFAPLPSLLAVLVIIGGFLLYCAVAAIGGALAGKQTDLGSTNTLFTLLLLASFLISILGKGSSSGEMVSDASWMNYVPFTAVLSLPSRLVLGQAGWVTGVVSLVIILLCTLLFAILAGRLYALLAFRKGNPPKVQDIPRLLKGE